MNVGDYTEYPSCIQFPIPGTIVRHHTGRRYQTIATRISSVSCYWSGKLPDMGKPFDPQLGHYVIEYIPSQNSYAYNKVQRQILKWLRNLDSVTDFAGKSTGSLMGQLAQFTVFHHKSEDETRKFFKQALNSLNLLDEGRLTEADLKKALKIIEPSKRAVSFKIGDVITRNDLWDMPAGSLVLFGINPEFVRLVTENKYLVSPSLHRLWPFNDYLDTDRFTVLYLNQ